MLIASLGESSPPPKNLLPADKGTGDPPRFSVTVPHERPASRAVSFRTRRTAPLG